MKFFIAAFLPRVWFRVSDHSVNLSRKQSTAQLISLFLARFPCLSCGFLPRMFMPVFVYSLYFSVRAVFLLNECRLKRTLRDHVFVAAV